MTTTPKFHTVVQTAEEEALPAVRVSRHNLATATALVPTTARDVDIAEDEVDEIEASWRALKDDHTPAEHAAAVSAHKRAELRHVGAKRWLERATREASSSDKTLANTVVPIVEKALIGVTAVSTFAEITAQPRTVELPIMLVQQRGETVLNPSGSVSGEVLLRYFSGSIHRDLDSNAVDALVAAADALGCSIEIAGRPIVRAGGVEEVTVRVLHANLDVPFLPVISPTSHQRLGGTLAAEVVTDCAYSDEQVKMDPELQAYSAARLLAMPGDTRVISEDIDDDGVRTLVMETSLLVERKKAVEHPSLPDRVLQLADRLNAGAHVGGLGAIESLEILTGEDVEHMTLDQSTLASTLKRASGLPVDAKGLGFETVSQFCFRAVFKSTTRRPHVEQVGHAA